MCDLTMSLESYSMQNLVAHIKRHGLRPFECIYCEYGNDTASLLREHLHTAHPNELAVTFERNKLPNLTYLGAKELTQYHFRVINDIFNDNVVNFMNFSLCFQIKYIDSEFPSVNSGHINIEDIEKLLKIDELISKFQ